MHISSSVSMPQMVKYAHGHQNGAKADKQPLGDKMVSKLDKNGDGGLSAKEIAGSKFGRRMDTEKFAKIDTDSNSQLSAKEINNYAETRKAARPSVGERIVHKLDGDGDGGVSIEELASTRFGSKMSSETFTSIDTDSDSKLSAAELDSHFEPEKKQPPSVGEALVAKLDNDGDGGVSIEELASTRFGKDMSAETFTSIDTDGDSKLSASELDTLFEAEAEVEVPTVGETVVSKLDGDGDGAVSIHELAGSEFGAKMKIGGFAKVDGDGDSKLSAEEITSFMEKAGMPGKRHGAEEPPGLADRGGVPPGGTAGILAQIAASQSSGAAAEGEAEVEGDVPDVAAGEGAAPDAEAATGAEAAAGAEAAPAAPTADAAPAAPAAAEQQVDALVADTAALIENIAAATAWGDVAAASTASIISSQAASSPDTAALEALIKTVEGLDEVA